MWKFKQAWKQKPHDVQELLWLLLGLLHKRGNYPWSALKLQWETHTLGHATAHTSRWKSTDPWPAKISNVQFPHDSPVNYWTELFLLIHTLVCTQWISYLSNTPVHTHTWLQAFSLHVPETWADGTLHGAPQFISCCLEQWSLNMFVSFTVKTEEARSHYWHA